MEHTYEVDIKKSKKEIAVRIAMTVSIYIAIALFLTTVIILINNIEEIKTDPIVYGINKNNFNVCTCYTERGESVDYNKEGIILGNNNAWNLKLD